MQVWNPANMCLLHRVLCFVCQALISRRIPGMGHGFTRGLHGVCLGFARYVSGGYPGVTWGLRVMYQVCAGRKPGDCQACTGRIPGVCQACTGRMPGVYQACTGRMPGVYHTRRVPDVCPGFTRHVPEICSANNGIYTVYAWYTPGMYQVYTYHIILYPSIWL